MSFGINIKELKEKLIEIQTEAETWKHTAEINGNCGFEWQRKFEDSQTKLAAADLSIRASLEETSRLHGLVKTAIEALEYIVNHKDFRGDKWRNEFVDVAKEVLAKISGEK